MPLPVDALRTLVLDNDAVSDQLGGVAPILEADPSEGGLGHIAVNRQYAAAAAAALAEFQRRTRVNLIPWRIKQRCPNDTPADPSTYDELESPLHYVSGSIDRKTLPQWHMRKRPIVSVQKLRLAFSEAYGVLDVPQSWTKVDARMGVVRILPIGTEGAVATQFGVWFIPLIDASWPWGLIPHFVHIDYTVGYTDAKNVLDLADSLIYIAKRAAGHVLDANQGLIPNAFSGDGFNQPFEPVGARIDRFMREFEDHVKSINRSRSGPRIRVI